MQVARVTLRQDKRRPDPFRKTTENWLRRRWSSPPKPGIFVLLYRKSVRFGPRSDEEGKRIMPIISEFFGIIIFMYWFDTQKHKMPHFHARFGGAEAVFDFTGNCLEGDLGPRAQRLISE